MIMRNILATIVLSLFAVVSVFAQETNKTDASGKKQGLWIKYHVGTKVKAYEGNFKNDKPVGEFKYWFSNAKPKAVMVFPEGGGPTKATLYFRNGGLMGEGNYIKQEKEGAWVYYGENGKKTSTESYVKGKKHGEAKVFFDHGAVAEVSNYNMDVLHGEWKTYYETNQVRQQGTYKNGSLDGEYIKFYKNGKPLVKGKYANAMKEGQWTFYVESGMIDYKELWKGGKLVREVKENGKVTLYYKSERKKSEHNYRAGKKDGDFREWNDDGEWKTELRQGDKSQDEPDEYIRSLEGQTLKRKGNYTKGKLHGKVYYYKANNIKDKIETYENGTLVKTETL